MVADVTEGSARADQTFMWLLRRNQVGNVRFAIASAIYFENAYASFDPVRRMSGQMMQHSCNALQRPKLTIGI
jgi:hypothetical protein